MDAPFASRSRSPHIGSVNAWLLRGDPLTLIDTGPRDDAALAALEAGLRRAGVRARGHRAGARHAPPPRPRRPRRDDRAPLGRHVAALDRAADYGGALRRARSRPTGGSRSRSCATTACPDAGHRRQRGLLGLHPRSRRRPSAPTSARRRRAHPRRRPRPARRRAARATARPTRCSSTTRRASRSSATTCSPRSPPTRRSTRPPEPDGRAARARASTWRACGARPRCRSPGCSPGTATPVTDHAALVARAWPTTSAAASGSSRRSRDGPRTAYEIARRPLAGADRRRAAAARRLGGARPPRAAARRRPRPRAGDRRRQHATAPRRSRSPPRPPRPARP